MRVGLLVYGLDRPLTGIGRYTVELVQALAAVPHPPELLLLAAGDPGPLKELQLPVARLPGCRLLPGLMTLGNGLIPLIARQHRLDIIHDCIGVMPMLFGAAPAKMVVTVHDLIPFSFPGVSTRLDTLIYRRWLPHLLPRADALLADSSATGQDVQHYLSIPAAKIRVVLPGVTSQYQVPTPDAICRVREQYHLPEQFLLFVGSVEERKNLRRVLQAFQQLRARGLTHKLVIVGPQKWKYAPILQTVQDLELEAAVIFTGYLPQEDLPAVYGAATVLVFPSLYEGFGLPPLEAMACGTPVITSNTSSLPEVVGDAGLTIDPCDIDALVQAVERVVTDAGLHQLLRERGLARVKEFGWQQTAQVALQVYEEVTVMP